MEVKNILKQLKTGTMIKVKDNDGNIVKMKFIKMNRTRFEVSHKGCIWNYPVSCYKGLYGKEDKMMEEVNKGKLKIVEKNVNPCNNQIGDCVVRSIAEALDKTWKDTLIDLTIEGIKIGNLFNYEETYKNYLLNNGFKEIKVNKQSIKSFIDNEAEDKTYIIKTRGHLTVVKNYTLIDTWDCSSDNIKKIWKLN